MLQNTRPLVHAIFTLLAIGLVNSHAGSSDIVEKASMIPAQWNRPMAFTLEARSVQKDAAFGLHVVRPIFESRNTVVLVEAYGYEGEGDLGIVGGGIIYRRIGKGRTFEANAFFDGLRSTDGFSYPQFGLGVAYGPANWVTLRANGYLPLRGNDSQHSGTQRYSEIEGSGNNRREVEFSREVRTERTPMGGVDAEVEFRLPKPPRWVDPRLVVGYAYREATNRSEVHSGPLVRGELHFGKHWVAEAEWRHDMHNVNQEWRVGVRFEMLFGGPEEAAVRPPVASNGKKKVSNGKKTVPLEEPPGDENGRDAEKYLPAQRFPWPTVARGVSRKKAERGDARALAPTPVDPNDCCPSGGGPLIFD